MPELTIPLLILFFGLVASLMTSYALMTNVRFRHMEMEERRRDKMREEEWRREKWDRGEWPYHRGWEASDYNAPTVAGDYFTLAFDKGPDTTAHDLAVAIESAVRLPHDLAGLGRRDDGTLDVRVHRVTYENPLDLILLVTGTTYLVGNVILWARQLNGAIQEIRRSQSETGAIVSRNDEIAARHEFRTMLYTTLADAIDEADARTSERRLQRLRRVVETAADHGLMAVTHTEVSAIEATGAQVRSIPSSEASKQTDS